MIKSSSRYVGVGFVLAIIFTSGLMVGRYALPGSAVAAPVQLFSIDKTGQRQINFPTCWHAWDELHRSFIDAKSLDDKKLLYGAVAGMVRAAGDPFTVFTDPPETKKFNEQLAGSFSGIGAEIGLKDKYITVIAPLKDSPAAKAGVLAGDSVAAIDGKPLNADATVDEVVQKIRGPRGTTVTLTLVHKDAKHTVDIPVVRDTIQVESVHSAMRGSIAHVSIDSFDATTADNFAVVAKQIKQSNATGMVLDVRGNPGGFLDAAVKIASQFVPEGSLVVTQRGIENTEEYRALHAQTLLDMPVVVLIDGGSASAAEILAGALRDDRHALLVGEKSFGKGVVEEQKPFTDGSSLRVTVAKWYTPSGTSIHGNGLKPDSEVKPDRTNDKTDTQLDRAVEELKKQIH